MLKIGHRGAAGFKPENTLSSFKKAIELKVDMIELDVHLTKTGRLVVIHDSKVNRTTNGSGKVSFKSIKEIKKLRIDKSETIPTLNEVFILINRRCKINIELKGVNTAKPTVRLIEKYVQERGWKYSDFLVSSFNFNELNKVRKKNKMVRIGLLFKSIPKDITKIIKQFNAFSAHLSFKQFKKSDLSKLQGTKIIVYTLNKKREIEQAKKMEIFGIISDFPNRI